MCCVQRESDLQRIREFATDSNFSFDSEKQKRKLRPSLLFVRKLRITFLVTYTHEVMTEKLNGCGHTRPVQTFPLSTTASLDTRGDFQGAFQIKVEAVKIATAQQQRGPHNSQG